VVINISRAAVLFALLSGSLAAANQYYVHALISDQPGAADLVDPNLSNPWGIQFQYFGPVLIADNSTGIVSLYLAIPPAIGTLITPFPHPRDPARPSPLSPPLALRTQTRRRRVST
jgi:hypothetical protein